MRPPVSDQINPRSTNMDAISHFNSPEAETAGCSLCRFLLVWNLYRLAYSCMFFYLDILKPRVWGGLSCIFSTCRFTCSPYITNTRETILQVVIIVIYYYRTMSWSWPQTALHRVEFYWYIGCHSSARITYVAGVANATGLMALGVSSCQPHGISVCFRRNIINISQNSWSETYS